MLALCGWVGLPLTDYVCCFYRNVFLCAFFTLFFFKVNELMGSEWGRNKLKIRKETEKNMYKEKLELMRQVKTYERYAHSFLHIDFFKPFTTHHSFHSFHSFLAM